MKKEHTDEKSCKNCRYYLQHYAKGDTQYHAVCCGHCISRDNKKMKPKENCELWEDTSTKKEEREKTIKQTLEFISEKLNEISLILKDD